MFYRMNVPIVFYQLFSAVCSNWQPTSDWENKGLTLMREAIV